MFGSLVIIAMLLLGVYGIVLTLVGVMQGKYIGRGFDVARTENAALFWFFNTGQFLISVVVIVVAAIMLRKQR